MSAKGKIDWKRRCQDLTVDYNVLKSELEQPISMVLFCPMCHQRHIDVGEFSEKPHHTHACQHCGFVWRPAVRHTVGVEFLPDFKDDPLKIAAWKKRPVIPF